MKKIYTISAIALLFFISGCSKDAFKSYEDRIVGTWQLTDVDPANAARPGDLSFLTGTFIFHADGTLDYYTTPADTYKGTWRIERKYIKEDQTAQTLQVTVVNFNTQKILTEYYDDISFTSSNKLRAIINLRSRSFRTYFER